MRTSALRDTRSYQEALLAFGQGKGAKRKSFLRPNEFSSIALFALH